MKKTERGSYDFRLAKDENIVVCKWNDNSVVSIASNALSVRPTNNVTRYSQKEKKNISVTQPHLVRVYNENMGGVDRCDQNISLYRISVRGNKWYFPLICHCIDLAEQNAWQLHKARKGSLDHLQFRRRVVTALLETNVKSSKGAGRPSQTEHVDSRYDIFIRPSRGAAGETNKMSTLSSKVHHSVQQVQHWFAREVFH